MTVSVLALHSVSWAALHSTHHHQIHLTDHSPSEPGLASSPQSPSSTSSIRVHLGTNRTRFYKPDSYLSPQQQYQKSTNGNSKHWTNQSPTNIIFLPAPQNSQGGTTNAPFIPPFWHCYPQQGVCMEAQCVDHDDDNAEDSAIQVNKLDWQ